jgi:hypothetical protein
MEYPCTSHGLGWEETYYVLQQPTNENVTNLGSELISDYDDIVTLEKILGNSESEEVVLICLKVFDKGASLN